MVAAAGISELLLVIVLGGGMSPAVFSLPPLPPDPKLAGVAPETCLLYMNWAGAAAPDPKSTNRTERLLAEAQVRGFLADVERALTDAFQREVGRDADAAPVARALPLLVRTLLTRPAALYISSFTPPGPGPPDVDGGLVVHGGDRIEVLRARVEALAAMAGPPGGDDLVVNGVTLRRVPAPIKVHWGVVDKYLFLAVGEKSPAHLVAALKSRRPAPRWLAELQEQLPVDRRASLTYLNLGPLREMIAQAGGTRGAVAIQAIGLDRIRFVGSTTGLDETGFITRSLIGIDGKLSGLLSLLEAAPLAAGDLKHIPADTKLAAAVRFDAAEAMKQFLAMMETIDPRAARRAAEELAEARGELGFDVHRDLLKPLGTAWSLHHVSGEGPAPFPGLVASVDVRDRERLNETLIRIETLVGREMRRDGNIRRLEVGDRTIKFVNPTGDEIPVAPAWCLTGSHLHLALYPQVLRAFLSHSGGGNSVAGHPQIARALASDNPPLAVGHMDTAQLVRTFYPVLYPLAAVALGEMQRGGIDLTIASLPDATVVARHLQGASTSVKRTSDGLAVTTRGTLPLGGGISLLTPATLGSLTGLRMKHAGVAVGAAGEAEAMAHLRMLSVATMSYAVDHNGQMPERLEELAPYLDEPAGRFRHDPRNGSPWLYLAKGKVFSQVQRPDRTPMFAASGSIRGRRIVVYFDGHVENLQEHRFLAQCRQAGIPVPRGDGGRIERAPGGARDPDQPIPVPGAPQATEKAIPTSR